MSHLANCTFLAQLIATLIHYPDTVALDLADFSAFLEQVLPIIYGQSLDNGAHGGHYMGGIGLIFTRMLVRCNTRFICLVCFSRVDFADHVKSRLQQWDPCRALDGR